MAGMVLPFVIWLWLTSKMADNIKDDHKWFHPLKLEIQAFCMSAEFSNI